MVAAVCSWHADHEPTAREIMRRLSRGEQLVAAGPALAEAYSVLTRLPAPDRLSPTDALSVLNANFIVGVGVMALNGRSYVDLLRESPSLGVFGGRIYAAVIVRCALKAKAQSLLTLNQEHFREWASEQLRIIVPSG